MAGPNKTTRSFVVYKPEIGFDSYAVVNIDSGGVWNIAVFFGSSEIHQELNRLLKLVALVNDQVLFQEMGWKVLSAEWN